METEKPKSKVPFIIAVVIAVLVITGAAFAWYSSTRTAAPPKTVATNPEFSFTGAPGWRKGQTDDTSMALTSDDKKCSASIVHRQGTVDIDAALKKQEENYSNIAPLANQQLALQTDSSNQPQYVLHQFKITNNDKTVSGLELGYVQLSDGYVEIQAKCATTAQLQTTIPALQAYKYSPQK